MTDSEAHPADGPALRVSDAERDAVVARLQHHYAVGRLSLPELEERVVAAVEARTREHLDAVEADLPHARDRAAPSPARAPAAGYDSRLLIVLLCVAPPAGLVYWLLTRRSGRPGCDRGRPRLPSGTT